MAKTFDAATVDYLRKTQEVGIRTSKRPDHTVIIWAIAVGNEAYVRSVKGPAGKWWKTVSADGHVTVEVEKNLVPARAIAVTDAPTLSAVSAEYLRKYATSPYAQAMVKPDTLPTTLRLEPA
jgi:hypothetical protein